MDTEGVDRLGEIASKLSHPPVLLHSEQLMEAVMSSGSEAKIIVRLEDSVILRLNWQAENLFWYPKEELIGQKIDILVPETVRHIHADHVSSYSRRPLDKPMGIGRDLKGVRKDGSEIKVEVSLLTRTAPEGRIVIATVTDLEALNARSIGLSGSVEGVRRRNVEGDQEAPGSCPASGDSHQQE